MTGDNKQVSGAEESPAPKEPGRSVIEHNFTRRPGAGNGIGFYRRWAPHLLAIAALVALVVISCLFWLEVSKRFPRVAAGSYVGKISGAGLGSKDREVKFYVERAPGSEDLFFVIMEPGWVPQVVSAVVGSTARMQSEWLLPVIVQGPSARLKFTGTTVGPGQYNGALVNLDSAQEGEWSLRALQEEPPLATAADSAMIRLWLLLQSELSDVEEKIAQAAQEIPLQKEEIERLTNLLTEGQELKSRANEKYALARDELHRALEELENRRQEAKRLEASFEVSQRVTAEGRLVSLARESLEREWRWVDSMLRAGVKDQSEDLQAAIDKGQKIFDLKQQLELEKEALQRLAAEKGITLSWQTETPAQGSRSEDYWR